MEEFNEEIKLLCKMETSKLWIEMLTTYCRKFGYDALTIPNVVAAYYRADNNINLHSHECVLRILQDIVDTDGCPVLIQRCVNLKQFVMSCYYGLNNPSIKERIYFSMYEDQLKTDSVYRLEDVSKKLYDIYKEPIVNKLFSYNRYEGCWKTLTEREEKIIEEIVGTL